MRSPGKGWWVAAWAAAAVLTATPAPAQAAEWLAGDGHVHTCYSHDSWCPEGDDNTGAETFYSSFATVEQRFLEASSKGLDFLVVSDHDDTRAWSDPAFGSRGVLGVRAYEASIRGGHAHMLGATRRYDEGSPADPVAAAVEANRMAAELEADGGIFQANHPSYRAETSFDSCEQAELGDWEQNPLHWRYGFAVQPGAIEVWNPTALLPPAELYWECWLQRGYRVPATAGSDSHGGNQLNLGIPTLWVLAADRSQRSILRAIRTGRTTITRRPPLEAPARLLLEAQVHGRWVTALGERVPRGARLRARLEGADVAGLLRIRANGRTLTDSAPIAPGGTYEFEAPAQSGWVRATLMGPQATGSFNPSCQTNAYSAQSPIDVCLDDLAITAMTSPVYVAGSGPAEGIGPARLRGATARPAPAHLPAPHELDDHSPLSPVRHSLGGRDLPRVPRMRAATLAR